MYTLQDDKRKEVKRLSILSDRIKEKRKERGWTQQDLAEQTSLSLDTIKSWESGRRTPNYTSIKVLCYKLHTTEDYLLGGKDHLKEWLSKYDSEHQDEIIKIRNGIKLLEYCDFIGCDTSELDSESSDQLMTGTTNYIKHNFNDFLNERGLPKMTRNDVKVIMNDTKNKIVDSFMNDDVTIYATSEEYVEKAFQQLLKRGMIQE